MRETARPANAASAVVLRRDGRVLLVQRARAPLTDTWTLPGGKLEPGEHPRDAAAREVREETGIHVVIGPHLADVEVATYRIAVYAATPAYDDDARLDAAAPADDARAVRWAGEADLASLDVPASTRDAIVRARALR